MGAVKFDFTFTGFFFTYSALKNFKKKIQLPILSYLKCDIVMKIYGCKMRNIVVI